MVADDWVRDYRREHPERPPVDPMACPWPRCDFVASDARERNRHVLVECEHRGDVAEKVDRRTVKRRCDVGGCELAANAAGLAVHRRHKHREAPG